MKECLIAVIVAFGFSIGCARYRYEIAQAWLAHEMRVIRRRLDRVSRLERFLSQKLETK